VTYAEFIDELRHLADQGDTLLASPGTHESRPFRDWRHEVESTVSNALELGFRLPGKFDSSIKPYCANWTGCSPADNKNAFNRDMSDSLTQLRFLIGKFDKYGAPAAAPAATPPAQAAPLAAPDKVTLKWLSDHVPIGGWAIALGVLGTTFMAGVAAGQYESVRNAIKVVLHLFSASPT
jgi:hypothetical protein